MNYVITDAELMKYCIEFFIFGWLIGFASFWMGQMWKARRGSAE